MVGVVLGEVLLELAVGLDAVDEGLVTALDAEQRSNIRSLYLKLFIRVNLTTSRIIFMIEIQMLMC
jgi:hypothetical protein